MPVRIMAGDTARDPDNAVDDCAGENPSKNSICSGATAAVVQSAPNDRSRDVSENVFQSLMFNQRRTNILATGMGHLRTEIFFNRLGDMDEASN